MAEVTNLDGTPFVPGSDLTKDQTRIARSLRNKRPAVIPGTNAIIDGEQATVWHDEVATAAAVLAITDAQGKAFFDLCGVAE